MTGGDARTHGGACITPPRGHSVGRVNRYDLIVNTVFNYPSLGDAYKYAAYDGLGAFQRRAAAGTQG